MKQDELSSFIRRVDRVIGPEARLEAGQEGAATLFERFLDDAIDSILEDGALPPDATPPGQGPEPREVSRMPSGIRAAYCERLLDRDPPGFEGDRKEQVQDFVERVTIAEPPETDTLPEPVREALREGGTAGTEKWRAGIIATELGEPEVAVDLVENCDDPAKLGRFTELIGEGIGVHKAHLLVYIEHSRPTRGLEQLEVRPLLEWDEVDYQDPPSFDCTVCGTPCAQIEVMGGPAWITFNRYPTVGEVAELPDEDEGIFHENGDTGRCCNQCVPTEDDNDQVHHLVTTQDDRSYFVAEVSPRGEVVRDLGRHDDRFDELTNDDLPHVLNIPDRRALMEHNLHADDRINETEEHAIASNIVNGEVDPPEVGPSGFTVYHHPNDLQVMVFFRHQASAEAEVNNKLAEATE